MCNESCKCSDCKNFEGSVDRASVLGLHPQLTSPPSAKRAKPSEPSHGGAAYAVRESGPASAPAEPPSAQAEAALDTPLVRARDAIARLYFAFRLFVPGVGACVVGYLGEWEVCSVVLSQRRHLFRQPLSLFSGTQQDSYRRVPLVIR